MWFRNRRADEYVVDTSRLTRGQEVEACRAALRVVYPYVERFQCDVPWDNQESWPREVVNAATILAPLPERAKPKQTYRTTGWISDFPENVWNAFVTFAPYAYDANAWTAEMRFLADVSDGGTCVSVRVLPDQVADFKHSVPGADVVPAHEWTRRHEKEWLARQ